MTKEEFLTIATQFCNKHSISSYKKREALAIVLIDLYYKGYEQGIDDLNVRVKDKMATRLKELGL